VKVKTISVQRIKNLGNYQSERLEMMAELDEDEDAGKAAIALRETIKRLLDATLPDETDWDDKF